MSTRLVMTSLAVSLVASSAGAASCFPGLACDAKDMSTSLQSEAACESAMMQSWQTQLPTLGYASKLASQAIDPVISQQLDHTWLAHPQFKGGRWPGITVAISQHNRLVFAKSYGFGDLSAPQLTHPDDLYRLASNSKQITGATILKLIHNGQSVDGNPAHKLTLDSKIFKILTSPPKAILPPGGLAAVKPELMNITVEEVLHHTGGWAYNIGDPVWYAFNISNPIFPVTDINVVKLMLTQDPSLSPPGYIFSYSNFGYNLLATLITKITGKDYETVVKEQVLNPIGITRSRVGQSLLDGRADGEVRYYAYYNSPPVGSLFPAVTGPTISGDDKIPYGSWSLQAGRGAGGWIASSIDTLRFQIGVNGRGINQVYPGISDDIKANHNQPSWVWGCNPTCGKQPIDPTINRYNAGWGVHYWGAPWNGIELDHAGGTNGNGAVTESIPDQPNVEGYGIALVFNTSPQPTAPQWSFDPTGAVRNAILALLPTTKGSLLDPGWSADTDFFDQYGDFSAYMNAANLNAKISSAFNSGCVYNNSHFPRCYASRIEGKNSGQGIVTYRAQIVPLHNLDASRYGLGQTCSAYVAMKQSLLAAGFQEVNLQWFADQWSRMRFQSVWIDIKH